MSSSKKTILGKHIVYHSWIFSTQKVKIRIFLKDHRSRNNSMTIIVISSTKLVPIDILYHVLPSNYHSHMMRKIKMAEKFLTPFRRYDSFYVGMMSSIHLHPLPSSNPVWLSIVPEYVTKTPSRFKTQVSLRHHTPSVCFPAKY